MKESLMENSPLRYFSQEQLRAIKRAETFESLSDIALLVLRGMPPGVAMVCGPITTGGSGSVEENLKRFARAIALLDSRGENIFTQLPFEAPMQKIKENKAYYKGGEHLLKTFYFWLFCSGYVTRLCFLPGWESSYGARWEHDRALAFDLEIKYLKENFELLGPDESPFVE